MTNNTQNSHYSMLLHEYDMVRSEIIQKIELRSNLLAVMYSSTIAILALSVTKYLVETPYACLLPILIVIPISIRVAYYQEAIAKLSAYQIVFLEPELDGVQWETRNDRALKAMQSEGFDESWAGWANVIVYWFRYFDYSFICVLCLVLFFLLGGCREPYGCVATIGCMVVAVFELFLSVICRMIIPQKGSWVKRWKRIRDMESGG